MPCAAADMGPLGASKKNKATDDHWGTTAALVA